MPEYNLTWNVTSNSWSAENTPEGTENMPSMQSWDTGVPEDPTEGGEDQDLFMFSNYTSFENTNFRVENRNAYGFLHYDPTRLTSSSLVDDFNYIVQWAQRNNLMAFIYRSDAFYLNDDTNIRLPSRIIVCESSWSNPGYHELTNNTITCPDCDLTMSQWSTFCTRCNYVRYCSNCMNYAERVTPNESGFPACEGCGYMCEICDDNYSHLVICNSCSPHLNCEHCREPFVRHPGVDVPQNIETMCGNCAEFVCHTCGTMMNEDDHGSLNCDTCLLQSNGVEEYDEQTNIPATKMQLTPIPGREMIRLVGVEIEGANRRGGAELARELYNQQYSVYDAVAGYHSGNRGGFAHIERDSSVDWEMVIGPIDMNNLDQVRMLNNCVKMIRKAITEDRVHLDMRCGTHIHVSAEKVGLHQAFNLHILYGYLEDVFFRLGAAKWSKHRSLVMGNRHTGKVQKLERKIDFVNTYQDNRYLSLSFSNYLSRMLNSCECGARRYGAWEECTCSMDKCTFEFRSFNATANTIKLHAYLALTQAIVAKAISMQEIKNFDDYPTMNFVEMTFKDMTNTMQDEMRGKWASRLNWLSNELPLTEKEKESILYCIENSELESVRDSFTMEGTV